MNSSHAMNMSQDDRKKYDELEGLPYIQALYNDKRFENLLVESSKLSPSKGLEKDFYYLVASSYYLVRKYQDSINVLLKNSVFLKGHSDYSLLLSRNYFSLSQFKLCSDEINKVSLELIHGDDWKIFRTCNERSNNYSQLLSVFLKNKIQDQDFFIQGQIVLLENSLHYLGMEYRQIFLERCLSVEAFLELNSVLEKFKIKDKILLERAHQCHPNASEVTSLLVKQLFTEGKFHSIAYLFEVMNAENPEFTAHVAEFFKVAGRVQVAEYYFLQADEPSYMLARASSFLAQEKFSELVTFPFDKLTISKNKDLSYALGFSAFKNGNNILATKYLTDKKSTNTKELALLDLIQKCKGLSWKCRP